MPYIYALHVKGSHDFRYVGQTISNPKSRLYAHRREANRGTAGYKNNWMRSVGPHNVVVQTLEEVDESLVDWREQFWIAALSEAGFQLVNRTEGGRGYKIRGPIHTEEQKKKWSEARKGSITGSLNPNFGKFGQNHPSYGRVFSDEAKAKLSESKKGPLNPNFGRVVSEEERQATSERFKGKPMPSSIRSAHTRHHTNKGVSKPETCHHCKTDLENT